MKVTKFSKEDAQRLLAICDEFLRKKEAEQSTVAPSPEPVVQPDQ
jgi:hypothetical protein